VFAPKALDEATVMSRQHCCHGDVVDMKSVISRSVWGGPNDEATLITLAFQSGATADLCASVVFQAPALACETHSHIFGSEVGTEDEAAAHQPSDKLIFCRQRNSDSWLPYLSAA